MAEEKMMHSKGMLFVVFGVLAIVYGIVHYLMAGLGWPNYTAWIVGGVMLLLIGLAKKS